ncbi:hypothetical protein COW36_02030 [bacterium (Candidatus Blackallbacteria) CG17_big_fil_post_rev_8_21_14_2_50_48_46]|uniref:UspA domain-containing protein n=1 Tax=bacterium (Candidatus Blackallbacteria) CG17_big_fil_post_rev_8_21_14_2_50_48_46 TaxID=2014261 RepID=A0A2M7GAM8_9BACT|nr:MAG: hypothetical protein COW64_26420 [bacterium (Candidatus Blackallbacteria) CG18_big_fil_WC_8_21_14_2_50_49_26]PIW19213.1 MAG: hypothetical protein COW36_02030 [bacterium (Candidatus Blackallbacteria) CG17_big_fil_post_rev_8_21_14_2_50_48_46]PIW45437.1 MAG: hypothetical protein COW20_20110 [bacterium (Candidatus Blackallbacteria) CG13_big_fil_rev_8_21_14_2_50_49_14]
MKIAVALNSHLISEHAALYALRYAHSLGMDLELLHVENEHDDLNEVLKRVARLEVEAGKLGIQLSFRKGKGKPGPTLVQMIQSHYYHTVFCSTRAHPPELFTNSVSQYLVRMRLPSQLVVVRINRFNTVYNCDRIGIFGGKGLPDVHQMALGIGLASSFQAEILLGNALHLSRRALQGLNFQETREILRSSDHGYRSLTTLCQLAGIASSIAHIPRGEDALAFFLSRKISLLVLSSRKLPRPTRHLMADPVENLFHLSPVNCMILYPKV